MAIKAEEILRKTVKTDVPVFRDRLREALTDRDMSQRQLALSMGKDRAKATLFVLMLMMTRQQDSQGRTPARRVLPKAGPKPSQS